MRIEFLDYHPTPLAWLAPLLLAALALVVLAALVGRRSPSWPWWSGWGVLLLAAAWWPLRHSTLAPGLPPVELAEVHRGQALEMALTAVVIAAPAALALRWARGQGALERSLLSRLWRSVAGFVGGVVFLQTAAALLVAWLGALA